VNLQPVISLNDVVFYDWSEYSIDLTCKADERFRSVEGKVKSTFGLPFVVMVGEEKVYPGSIYPCYSS
jgi:hypothetical protein